MEYVTTTTYRKSAPPQNGQRKKRRWTGEEDLFLKESCASMTMLECAKQLDRSFDSVAEHVRHLRKKGFEISFRKTGKNHPNHKYSADDVELVRALHDEGISIAEASRKMEVPYHAARDWVQHATRRTN